MIQENLYSQVWLSTPNENRTLTLTSFLVLLVKNEILKKMKEELSEVLSACFGDDSHGKTSFFMFKMCPSWSSLSQVFWAPVLIVQAISILIISLKQSSHVKCRYSLGNINANGGNCSACLNELLRIQIRRAVHAHSENYFYTPPLASRHHSFERLCLLPKAQ